VAAHDVRSPVAPADFERTFHVARKLEENPVFKPTTPDEIGPEDGQGAVCHEATE
jgi:hypothetical protein